MGIFRKSDRPSRERLLDKAVESARGMIRAHGHIDYRSKEALDIGVGFIGHLESIYRLGGCGKIGELLRETEHDRKYFYDKLNWFHKQYCSS